MTARTHSPASTDEIVLVTRLKTLNNGNQALSAAWLAMLERAFPGAPIRVLERRPRHLQQYTLRELANDRDPFAAFDAITTKLAREAPGPSFAGNAIPTTRILLDETVTPPARFVALRQRLNLRGRAARLGLYLDEYRRRLSAYQRARLVVVNPAGEFFPREPLAAFYHLLDAHVARKLGRPTAIVNHTMDITDPTLRRLIPSIYRTLDLVGFRDDKSVAAFREMGGDLSNVLVTPDLALTTELRTTNPRRTGTVALAVNVPEATASRTLAGWERLIGALRERGIDLVLVSNEMPVDLPFYEQLVRRFPGLRVEGANLDHDRYGELLGTFDVVVSSRMHTGVLAMIAGTPVVPIEGSSFKITGLFQELGVQAPVIDPTKPDWPARTIERILEVRAHRDHAASDVLTKIGVVRERINSLLVPRLRSAAAPHSNAASPS